MTEACAAALASYKQPQEIHILDEFPRAALEKVAKAQLRRMLEDAGTV